VNQDISRVGFLDATRHALMAPLSGIHGTSTLLVKPAVYERPV
jgi:hypothetical protein